MCLFKSILTHLVAIVLTLTSGTLCQAEIHKCAGSVFTDKPCADGRGTIISSKTELTGGNINFQTNIRTYTVHGATFEQVIDAMHNADPFTAWARWAVAFNFTPKQNGNSCVIDNLNIAIAGDILMPVWAELSSSGPRDSNAWHKMYDILQTHENGHIQNGRDFAVLLREKLFGIGYQPCDKLQTKANQTKDALNENLKLRDAEYDYRTKHGLPQFNPR